MIYIVLSDEENYSPLAGSIIVEADIDYLDDHDLYAGDGDPAGEFISSEPYFVLDEDSPQTGQQFFAVLRDGEHIGTLNGSYIVDLPAAIQMMTLFMTELFWPNSKKYSVARKALE